MKSGRYEYVFDNLDDYREVCGSLVVTCDGVITEVTGMLTDLFQDGVRVADVGLAIARANNGYYSIRYVESETSKHEGSQCQEFGKPISNPTFK